MTNELPIPLEGPEPASTAVAATGGERQQFEAYLIQRQRNRGFGSWLTDEEMLASLSRSGVLESCWDVWQTRAALATIHEPVAFIDRADLADLQKCNGRSLWAESPRIWTPQDPTPPAHLVAVYIHPSKP